MTEDEWIVCEEPETMLKFLRLKSSDRKMRLFCCACCRRMPAALGDALYETAADLGEEIAEGNITMAERASAETEMRAAWLNYGDSYASWAYASELAYIAIQSEHPWGYLVATSARDAAVRSVGEGLTEEAIGLEQLDLLQPTLLRDIFGNPFRPVAFDPTWRTDTTLPLARQMYESRDFGAMPILADALQDAGCENSDILNHCRDASAPHVGGCWVVDLVLGKA